MLFTIWSDYIVSETEPFGFDDKIKVYYVGYNKNNEEHILHTTRDLDKAIFHLNKIQLEKRSELRQ